jgi:hypothetical protein
MSWQRNLVALSSTEGDVTQSGTTTVVAAPTAPGMLVIRTLTISADTDGSAALKSGSTRRGPKVYYSANGGVALQEVELSLTPGEAFNITWTGGGNVSYYCEYNLIPAIL